MSVWCWVCCFLIPGYNYIILIYVKVLNFNRGAIFNIFNYTLCEGGVMIRAMERVWYGIK